MILLEQDLNTLKQQITKKKTDYSDLIDSN